MTKKPKSGWEYVDVATQKSRLLAHVAQKAKTSHDYIKAEENYKRAAEVIDTFMSDLREHRVNLLEGARSSAYSLSVYKDKYLKEASKLEKKAANQRAKNGIEGIVKK